MSVLQKWGGEGYYWKSFESRGTNLSPMELTLTSLAVLLGAAFYAWCLFRAYPIYLDRQVKRGKSWVYLPKFWRGSTKNWVLRLTPIFKWGMVGLLTSVFFLLLNRFQLPMAVVAGVSALFATAVVHYGSAFLIKSRFHQQEKFYFDKLTNQFRIYEEQGHAVSEIEVRNLVSWEFQNSLRRADEAGELLQVLRLHSQVNR